MSSSSPRLLIPLLLASLTTAHAEQTFKSRYANLRIDDKGFVTSLKASDSGKEYSPQAHPSALMSLHETGRPNSELIAPTAATYDAATGTFTLKYPNGSTAAVKAEAKGDYFRFQLISLAARDKVDNIVWGPLNTTISGQIGDIIGVVRDPDFAG
jgi:hypothetical protein